MGVITYEHEITSSIPQKKVFKAFVLDADNLLPKILPQAVKSVQILEGNGGVGTLKLITYGEASKYKSATHRVDEIDEANCIYKFSVVKGDVLGDVLDSISYVIKIEAAPDGGSVCKTISTYHTKEKDQHIIEEKIKEGKERTKAMFKAIEAHLHANHASYN
ncbi:hypothetical protein RD792_017077 [Penstemon davidsonii]|uniref:Bet v I/Major latex protein domain-containing protein n=1 Tax=Penstemon davidsonii TaxID=160366 RepID=A0ABR0CL14_9LAMI|nr:hypothetical protein RD792_017077 [Penstemon davidsonii]